MNPNTQNRFQIEPADATSEPKTPLWIDLFAANGIFAAVMGTAIQLALWLGVEPEQPIPTFNMMVVFVPVALVTGILLRRGLPYRAARIAAWLVLGFSIALIPVAIMTNAEM